MATANDVLNQARKRIGYYASNDPLPGSEAGRWMAEQTGESWLRGSSTSIAWCACFASMCLGLAGQTCPGAPSYNCDNWVSKARKNGGTFVNKYNATAGDIVFFDWNGNGSLDHVGIVEVNVGQYLQTIEGNTSNNRVARRTRSFATISCVLRPSYAQNVGGQTGSVSQKASVVQVDGYWGSGTTKALQNALGTPTDGIVSDQYAGYRHTYLIGCTTGWDWTDARNGGSTVIKALQKKIGTTVDGVMGPKTVTALQKYLGCKYVDGVISSPSNCVKALQRRINNGSV